MAAHLQAGRRVAKSEPARRPDVLACAPEELIRQPLRRIGEGIGKVVYASDHWVVKRERSRREIIALIVLWRILAKAARLLPARLRDRLLSRPSRLIRFLRVLIEAVITIVPRGVWLSRRIYQVWKNYRSRARRGERLANTYLSGTSLVPRTVTFPPARVQVGGWLGWLVVCEATERVERTLYDRLVELAEAGRFDEVERWLDRYLELRQSGWSHGLFSLDAHLKNFGVCGDRIVLLDPGGLTNRWSEIESYLAAAAEDPQPHVRLGLGELLESRPDIAARFDARWRAIVNESQVRRRWPENIAS